LRAVSEDLSDQIFIMKVVKIHAAFWRSAAIEMEFCSVIRRNRVLDEVLG
jgi:hypothetical protein